MSLNIKTMLKCSQRVFEQGIFHLRYKQPSSDCLTSDGALLFSQHSLFSTAQVYVGTVGETSRSLLTPGAWLSCLS